MKIQLVSEGLFPLYLEVACRPCEGEWDVQDIEIYADPEHERLIADDTWDSLPETSKLCVWAALNAHEFEKSRIERELADIMDEPDDDHAERAAERADYAKQELDQDLRDAGRGHLVRP